jgi:hypothetical protein
MTASALAADRLDLSVNGREATFAHCFGNSLSQSRNIRDAPAQELHAMVVRARNAHVLQREAPLVRCMISRRYADLPVGF